MFKGLFFDVFNTCLRRYAIGFELLLLQIMWTNKYLILKIIIFS